MDAGRKISNRTMIRVSISRNYLVLLLLSYVSLIYNQYSRIYTELPRVPAPADSLILSSDRLRPKVLERRLRDAAFQGDTSNSITVEAGPLLPEKQSLMVQEERHSKAVDEKSFHSKSTEEAKYQNSQQERHLRTGPRRESSSHSKTEQGGRQQRERKPIFFHHISKAGGTYINAIAQKNGEVTAGLRFPNSICPTLTNCSANVTFVQLEGSLENLSPAERDVLFKDKKWITWTQVRSPRALEESWFKEIKYGYKHECIRNKTFADYFLDPTSPCQLKRTNSILQFLGGASTYGNVENATALRYQAQSNLELMDLVTVLEDMEHSVDMMRSVFGWSEFNNGRSSWPKEAAADVVLSDSQESILFARLADDIIVYEDAVKKARQGWLDWKAFQNNSSKSIEPFETRRLEN